MKTLQKFILFIGFSLTSFLVGASSFFFPDINPTYYPREAPEWLINGSGNDGYLTITSEVVPVTSCVSLSNKSFWGGEKTQLIISITSKGFYGQPKEVEIPIATFDGRNNGNECASLSTLPMKIISNSLMPSFSKFNSENLSLNVNVRTSSNSSSDLIGSAQFLLGAAAMITTSGASAAIGGITSTLSNPVISEAQQRTSEMLKGSLNGKVPMTFTWPDIRNGVEMIEIPIFRAEGSLGNTPDKKIQLLQTDPNANKTKLLTIKLSFNYIKTIFDPSAASVDDFPNREGLASASVLNHLSLSGNTTFLQLLNDSSPSLLLTLENVEGKPLTNACSIALDKLKKAGLNYLDSAIVLKSFIDEAKHGPDWYTKPQLVKSCFSQAPNIQAYLPIIYGASEPRFVIGDVQDGIGINYTKWRDAIGPPLIGLRQAIKSKSNIYSSLEIFNSSKDVQLSYASDVQPWQLANEELTLPGLAVLANQEILNLGCFSYKDATNLNLKSPSAYLILQTNQNLFLGLVSLATDNQSKIHSLKIFNLTPDWKAYFKSLQFPGGECKSIISKF